jgi:uncharacterized GH25 family protein
MGNLPCGRFAGAVAKAVLVVFGGVTLLAHDMWIEPTSYRPQIGRSMGLRLRVGQDFLGDPLPRDPALIEKFVVLDGTGEKPVVGRDGADPAGLLRPNGPGLMLVGYFSKPSPVVLTSQKFNQYLSEEGLEEIAAMRARRGETNAEAHELFVRCAKTLLLTGPAAASQHDRVLGFPLEIVAERNPYLLRPGGRLPLRLLYRDRPIAGVLVVALNQRERTARVAARSDRAGRVQLALAQAGPWLIKAVHMIPASSGATHEWDSFWASLTFELPDGAGSRSASGLQ